MHFKVWDRWSKSQLDLDSFQYHGLWRVGTAIKRMRENDAFPRRTFYFPPRCTAAGSGKAPALPSPVLAPPGQDPKAAGPVPPRNATAAAEQTATPLPRSAVFYLFHKAREPRGKAHVGTGRAASSPGGARQGKRKGLGPCAPALDTAGLGFRPEALTFRTKSVR